MNFDIRPPASRHQQGNTLIGVIIGLVIGLIIAVIVALAITKGATPFTDKLGRAGKAAEPSAGKVTDPNQPMYGNKDPARGAIRGLAKEPRPQQPDLLQQVVANLRQEPAPAQPEAKPAHETGAAVVDKSKPVPAAPAPAAAKSDADDDKFVYYLQVGAFREMADAESVRAKLALLGYEASVTDRSTDSGVLHRVRMGPYHQVELMHRARTRLSENGVDVAVVRNQK